MNSRNEVIIPNPANIMPATRGFKRDVFATFIVSKLPSAYLGKIEIKQMQASVKRAKNETKSTPV
jgi:hypothetical protein